MSGNDSSGFTYRGRFIEPEQPVQIGFDVSQKSHNSLRWLIERQGYRNGDLVYVAWSPKGTELPDPFGSTFSFFGEPEDEESSTPQPNDAAQHFATQLKKDAGRLQSETRAKREHSRDWFGLGNARPVVGHHVQKSCGFGIP